ncbi:hypothetical protein [Actinoplanes sp. N902-109]|uniref:hypothetical protein n=1 Tax=Actinoplanes sp. (strain N902-109) TaxID=649831 RepID=UPI0003296879|nr:hypothetical protein [Actinoplanes sp. N902-109]AGL14309.1 hypothetical protein L083_0799 [Actinoplanes sp. N902-109]
MPGIDLAAARLTAESALLGLVAGAAVVGPWTRGGYLLLLDWVAGPHQALTPGLYGLDPAALDALPYRLATHAVRTVVGSGVTAWLLILLFFPVAAGGVSALAGGGRWRRHPAALFACCNPFVVERLQAGHVAFLLSVALLCWLLASALRSRRRDRWFAARPAGWYALAMAVGPHAAWLGGAGLLAFALLPRPRYRDLIRTIVVIACAGCIYAYAVVVVLSAILTVNVGPGDLQVYSSHAGPHGLLPTLLSLRGFWRGAADSSPQLSLGLVPGAVMILAALGGLARLCRRDPVAGLPLAALALTGLLLGAGIEGPLAGAYRAAFDYLPLFAAMREQQKWVALTMIAYAVGVGVTAEALATFCRSVRAPVLRTAGGAALLALAGAYLGAAPSLFWGLGGTVQVSHYPAAWYTADRIMGPGTEAVLFLPWHEYQPFDFTNGRTVGTPAGAFFRRPVLSSDAVELGVVRTNSSSRRMAYLQRLVVDGGYGSFGRLVAPLGIRYVALARDREADAYSWLDSQRDLTAVLRTEDLILYRVEPSGTGRVQSARAGDYPSTVALAGSGRLGSEAVLSTGAGGGVLPSAAAGRIRRTSSTSWRIEAGPAGWVVIPEEFSAGWSAGGAPSRPTVAGTVAFHVGDGAVKVTYTPWRWLRLGIAASVLSLLILLAAGLLEHRRELFHRPGGWGLPLRRPARRPSRPPRAGPDGSPPAPPSAASRPGGSARSGAAGQR